MATLTTVKGANTTLKENVPADKLDVTQSYGKLRVLYDSYTVDAADEFGTSGVIRLFTIPKGARLISCEASMPASGATGKFNLGWAASADGAEAVSANGIIALADPGEAAVDKQLMLSTVAGYMKKFAGEVEVQASFTEATADSGGDTLEVMAIVAVE